MSRKKKYNKEKPAPAAPPPASADAATPAEADAALVPGREVTPAASSAELAPSANRPEWAVTLPVLLESAEDESFWFAFALAVMACSPPVMAIPAALLAAGLGARIFRALWSVPAEVAPEDIGNARLLAMATAVLAALYRVSQTAMLPMIWLMCAVFFFNALRNVRVMVAMALRGGAKKKRKERQQEAAGGEDEKEEKDAKDTKKDEKD